MTRKSKRRNHSQDLEAQPRDEDFGQRGAHEMRTLTSGRNSRPEAPRASGSNTLAVQADREGQAGSSIRSQVYSQKDSPSDSGDDYQPGDHRIPSDAHRSTPPEMPPMIGDFDDNANAFWSLHTKETKSYDEARIQTLKDDMDSVLIFAGLFSAALVAFIIDKAHELKVDPAEQMVYYQQQNVALLAQISQQVSSLAPQVPITSTPPPPYPDFAPGRSAVRVNAFWFMSLVFSISAALVATLVQQWVRNYMHVFQRYSNPLKSARLRQYLYEGREGWLMPMVAESVPGLVHVSLFFFFLGLGDSLLGLDKTTSIATIVPIAICGLLYVLSMFAPIVNSRSLFRNPFSSMILDQVQKAYSRGDPDRASGKALSSDLSTRKVQLAMEENEERKVRDVEAIRWFIDSCTEDDEMESFVMAMPGTFTSRWGVKVWRKVSEVKQYEDAKPRSNDSTLRPQLSADLPASVPQCDGSPLPQHTYHPNPRNLLPIRRIFRIPTPNIIAQDVDMTRSILHPPNSPQPARDIVISDLCKRVRRLIDTCHNRSLFANTELWRKRARGCVETVASLVLCADIELELFGDLGNLLCELGKFERIRELSAMGSGGLFITRWTCLSLVIVTQRILKQDMGKDHADLAIARLSMLQIENDGEQSNTGDTDGKALENSRRIDDYFETASKVCTHGLIQAFGAGQVEEQVGQVLVHDHEADISKLEKIAPAADQMERIDMAISEVNRIVNHGLGVHLPGVSFDEFKGTELIRPTEFFNLPVAEGREFTPQFVFLGQRLRLLCSYAPKLRDIIDGPSNGVYQEVLMSLGTLRNDADYRRSVVGQQDLMERQLWRLLDFRDGGGFGFSVELFFLVLPQLLSMAPSQDTNVVLYTGTFRAITSDWRQHKASIGTQRVILNLICDIAIDYRGIMSNRSYPEYITNELLVLFGKMIEGQSGSHFDDAIAELRLPFVLRDPLFAFRAIKVISPSRANVPAT